MLKVHDICPNIKFNCQKQLSFIQSQFQLDGARFQNTMKKNKGSEKAWNFFLEPAVNTLAPVIGMALGAKSKNPKVGPATTNSLKNI